MKRTGFLRNVWLSLVPVMLAILITACDNPTTAERLELAREAFDSGEPRTADIHLKNLLLEDPDNARARELLGRVSLALGEPAAAESQLRRAVELGIGETSVQIALLHALSQQRKYEALLEQLDDVPDLSGDDYVSALQLAAIAHEALGDSAKAEAAHLEALSLAPDSPAVMSGYARFLLARARAKEASELVADVLERAPAFVPALLLRAQLEYQSARLPAAEETLAEVIRVAGSDSEYSATALALLAETQLARGELEGAAEATSELLHRNRRDPTARYLSARVKVARGELRDAEIDLQGIVSDAPDFTPAILLFGAINLEQGELGQARMYLEDALASGPGDESARLLLAETYLRDGDLESARNLLAESDTGSTSDAVLLALAGRANQRAGDLERAIEFFDLSEEASPQGRDELIQLSSIFMISGELERANRLLDAAAGSQSEDDGLADYLLILLKLRQGDLDTADEFSRRLVAEKKDSARLLALRGVIAILRKDLESAHELFIAAMIAAPEDATNLINLARTELLMNDLNSAADHLRDAVEIDPSQDQAILVLAEIALRRDQKEDARQWLERAPESSVRARLEGELASAEGRDAEAAEHFFRAFELRPGGDAALRAFAAARRAALPEPDAVLRGWLAGHPDDVPVKFSLATFELEHGNEDAAIVHFESILSNAPSHPGALNNLAWLYGQRGDLRGAIELAHRAAEADPDNPAISDTLGWLHVLNGTAAAGLSYLEQAARDLPMEPEVQYHWAVALADTGRNEEAVRILEVLLAQDEEYPWRDDARSRLNELSRPVSPE